MNDVIDAIKSRRSVRAYISDRLSREALEAIVEAGLFAPTGCNKQAWHFSVVQDRKIIEAVNEKAKAEMAQRRTQWIKKLGENPRFDITHGAPVLIVISAGKGAVSPTEDCSAALQNCMLAAQSLGIGSCWLGFAGFTFNDRELMARLGVPEGFRPREAAVFGIPAEGAAREAPARKRDVVSFVGEFM